ncbi:MAG: leucine-rich repeat domain-containing protein [Bacteroides sp.]|nr:leucine-rich repeat domain-containing protein [Bacteroides sp.]MCM1389407.1 leucine-rich repeat domain-containing protein [Bacteroides sp.]
MKQKLRLYLCALIALLIPSWLLAQERVEIDGLYYFLSQGEENTAQLTNKHWDSVENSSYVNGDLVIPSSVKYDGIDYIVNSIGSGAFSYCKNLQSIVIPTSVTEIGSGAFQGCTAIKELFFPDGITVLQDRMFEGCQSLESFNIPATVKGIGSWAFMSCRNLKSINIPDGVEWIGSNLFEDTYRLRSITIPKSVTTIAVNAFRGSWATIYNWSNIIITDENSQDYGLDDWNNCYYNMYAKTELWEYVKFGDNLSVIRYKGNEKNVTIPAEYNGIPVTKIGESLFNANRDTYSMEGLENTNLNSVEMPNSITTIGSSAFYHCVNLENVVWSNSLDSIGSGAFSGCANLASVEFGDAITSIGSGAFSDCTSLTSVELGNAVTSIEDNVFNGCTSLTSVKWGDAITSIGNFAFSGCTSLASVELGDAIDSIGSHAFRGCSALTEVALGNSLEYINESTFSNCSALTEVTFGNSLKSIGSYAFQNCSKIKSVTIPNSVINIGENAFLNCLGIDNVILGDSVETIGQGAFEFTGITSIRLPKSLKTVGYNIANTVNSIYLCDFDQFCNLDLTDAFPSYGVNNLYINNQYVSELEIPNTVKTFKNWKLAMSCIEYVSTGNGITTIPKCENVKNKVRVLELGTSVKSVAADFPEATLVISHAATAPTISGTTFPKCDFEHDGIIIVDDLATENAYKQKSVWSDLRFSNMGNVAEVTVSEPGKISADLLKECNMAPSKVVNLKVHGSLNASDFEQMNNNMMALIQLDLSDASIESIPGNAMKGKVQITSLLLPGNTKEIGAGAFDGCFRLKSASIPASVKSIGTRAFAGTSISEVEIPYGLQTIDDEAFADALVEKLTFNSGLVSIGSRAFKGYNLKQRVDLPATLQSIGDEAFLNQPITDHLTLPESLTSLGSRAFANTAIESVFIPGKLDNLASGLFADCANLDRVYVPDNIEVINSSVFENCSSLYDFRFSQNLTAIDSRALRSTSLTSIIVPEGITEISSYMMADNASLRSVSLPSTTTRLYEGALARCRALRNLTVNAIEPPTVENSSVISGINTDKCILSIPTVSFDDYLLSNFWGRFCEMRNDIAVEITGEGEVSTDNVETEVPEVIDPQLAASAFSGVQLSRNVARNTTTSATPINDGSTVFVPRDGKVRFVITPKEGEQILSATLDGVNILPLIKNGEFVTTADKRNGKLIVKFSGSSSAVEDIDIDQSAEVEYYDLNGIKVENPQNGIFIRRQGMKSEKVVIR